VLEPVSPPDVVVLASGSEVALACESAAKLAADGIVARVVSTPCLELWEQQPEAYRDALVPPGLAVVAVEAARGESYRRWTGARGLIQGIDRFGASAPAGALAEAYGFTPDRLAARIRAHLRG
jgi:transketolase